MLKHVDIGVALVSVGFNFLNRGHELWNGGLTLMVTFVASIYCCGGGGSSTTAAAAYSSSATTGTGCNGSCSIGGDGSFVIIAANSPTTSASWFEAVAQLLWVQIC